MNDFNPAAAQKVVDEITKGALVPKCRPGRDWVWRTDLLLLFVVISWRKGRSEHIIRDGRCRCHQVCLGRVRWNHDPDQQCWDPER